MAEPSSVTERKVLAVVNRHTKAKEQLEAKLVTSTLRVLAELFAAEQRELGLTGTISDTGEAAELLSKAQVYTPEAMARREDAVRRIAAMVTRAEMAVANLVQAQHDAVARIVELDPAPTRTGYAGERPRDVDPQEEWKRPVFEFLEQARSGLDPQEAAKLAAEKLQVQISDDLNVATRAGNRDWLKRNKKIATGYRRVLHPELSEGGSCGLCIVAATRVYKRADLHPLHARCKCGVLPVFEGTTDIADALNVSDINSFIKRFTGEAQSGRREDLKKLRYTVVDHSELGPQFKFNRADSSRQIGPKQMELRGSMKDNPDLRRRNRIAEAQREADIEQGRSSSEAKDMLAALEKSVRRSKARYSKDAYRKKKRAES